MKQMFPLTLALFGACSSTSNDEPDTSVDWSMKPIDLAPAQRPAQAGELPTLFVVPVSCCLIHEIKLKRAVAAEAVLSHRDGPNDSE